MESALIVGLMVLGIVARLASILRMASDRLAFRYPLFGLMTVYGAARTVVLLVAIHSGDRLRLYPHVWQATEGVTLALQAAACVEAFWILALHFHNIKAFGTILLGIIVAVAAILGYCVVASWSGSWASPLTRTLILLQRVGLALVVIALLSRLFFRQFPTVPVKPNAVRHLAILTLLFGSFFATGFGGIGPGWFFASNLAVTLGAFLAYSWWAISMTSQGEELPFPPSPPLSPQEFEEADAVDRRKMGAAVRSARATPDQMQ